MEKITKLFTIAFVGLLVIMGSAFGYLDHYRTSESDLSREITVIIPKGSGFEKTVDLLKRAEVIDSPMFFKAMMVLDGGQSKIKAGEYTFPAHTSAQAVSKHITSGKVIQRSITLPEGWIIADITKRLNAEKKLTGSVPSGLDEGSLLPDTYFFLRDDTRASIIRRMQGAMEKSLDKLWKNRQSGLPIKTKEEAVILASIVEKETGLRAERGRVAAVFINRLRKGMKLQSDPTTIYGVYKDTGARVRSLTRKQLRSENEYNTYYIPRLPPHPIANPGREAIEAVLNPPKTDELYFVATGTGGHNFARSLNEHNANVTRYRIWERSNR